MWRHRWAANCREALNPIGSINIKNLLMFLLDRVSLLCQLFPSRIFLALGPVWFLCLLSTLLQKWTCAGNTHHEASQVHLSHLPLLLLYKKFSVLAANTPPSSCCICGHGCQTKGTVPASNCTQPSEHQWSESQLHFLLLLTGLCSAMFANWKPSFSLSQIPFFFFFFLNILPTFLSLRVLLLILAVLFGIGIPARLTSGRKGVNQAHGLMWQETSSALGAFSLLSRHE